jgi:hypothetical protein
LSSPDLGRPRYAARQDQCGTGPGAEGPPSRARDDRHQHISHLAMMLSGGKGKADD